MTERPKSEFFSVSLGPLPVRRVRAVSVTSKVEATAPTSQGSEYEQLVAALTPVESEQLKRVSPFVQKLISQIQQKYKSSEFRGVLVEQDRLSIDFPEKLSPTVLSAFTLLISREYQSALDAHNAQVSKPERTRSDLDKLN